jgi:alternative NADH:quinone oxidoreductase NDH2-like protein
VRGSNSLKAFRYRPIGSLASLGQRQAIAEIGSIRLSGLPAWLAWRTIYLSKLPTLANKMRVGLDWIKELITPIDTVQIPISRETLGGYLATAMPAPHPPAGNRPSQNTVSSPRSEHAVR